MIQRERRSSIKDFYRNGPPTGTLEDSLSQFLPDFEVRSVRSLEEFESASRIVHDEYVEEGLIQAHPSGLKLTRFQLLPATQTYIVARRGTSEVLATLTMVVDSPWGLPMESIFKMELSALRLDGRRLVEFTRFAMDKKRAASYKLSVSDRQMVVLHLMRGMFNCLRLETDADGMVECYHPDHHAFYKRMGVDPFPEIKFHPGVKGLPAQGAFVDVKLGCQSGMEHMPRRMFLRDLSAARAPQHQLSGLHLMNLFVERTNILQSLSPEQRQLLIQLRPDVPWNRLVSGKSLLDHLIENLEHKRTSAPY